MAKQIIAVDIDGVLANWVGSALPRLNRILNTDLDIEQGVSFDLHESFGVSRGRMHEALDALYKEFSVTQIQPIENSQKTIKRLSHDYDIVAITARPKILWKDTYAWVKDNYDNLIEVYFGTAQGKPFGAGEHEDEKLALCKRFNAKYLVEDNPAEILEALKTSTTPLCHAWPWNKSIEDDKRIIRGDWLKLEKYIYENEKKKTSN